MGESVARETGARAMAQPWRRRAAALLALAVQPRFLSACNDDATCGHGACHGYAAGNPGANPPVAPMAGHCVCASGWGGDLCGTLGCLLGPSTLTDLVNIHAQVAEVQRSNERDKYCHLSRSCTNCSVNGLPTTISCGTANGTCVIPTAYRCGVDCDPGYYFRGSDTRNFELKCGSSGQLMLVTDGSSFQPLRGAPHDVGCEACPEGQYKGMPGNVGCIGCEAGQTTSGQTGARVCQPPTTDWCNATLSVPHAAPDGCKLSGSLIMPGSTCTTMGCAPGYVAGYPYFTHAATFRCGNDGKWSQILMDDSDSYYFVCNPAVCPVLSSQICDEGVCISTGTCTGQHHYGEPDCEMYCPSGYQNGYRGDDLTSGIRHCDEKGKWKTVPNATYDLKCVADCVELTVPKNGKLVVASSCTGNHQGAVCSATCKQGYYRSSGNSTRTCEINSNGPGVGWSGDPLICTSDYTCPRELDTDVHIGHWGGMCNPECGNNCTAWCSENYLTADRYKAKDYTCDCEGENPVWKRGLPGDAAATGIDTCLGCFDGAGKPVKCDCDFPPVENALSCHGMATAGEPVKCNAKCKKDFNPTQDRSHLPDCQLDCDMETQYVCGLKNATEPDSGLEWKGAILHEM